MRTTTRAALTAKHIERMQPGTEEPDAGAPGLRLRVTPNGVKSFRWAVREAGAQRWITLGRWSAVAKRGYLTINEARRWLERLKDAHHAGAGELARVEAELQSQLEHRQIVDPAKGKTVGDVAADFWKALDGQRKRGSTEAQQIYGKHFALIADVPLSQLTRSDCRGVVQRAFDGGAKVRAAKVLAILKQLLDFAERNIDDDEFTNPAARLKAADFGVQATSRERWLDEQEIPAFWKALEWSGGRRETETERRKMAAALRLLLLTAVRTGELRLAEWSHIDLKAATFTIPVKNQKLALKYLKKAKDFVIPLTPTAAALFEELRGLAGPGARWVLPSLTSTAGVYDDKSIGRFMRRLWVGEKKHAGKTGNRRTKDAVKPHPALAKFTPASPHDLRRTARTWWGEKLGIAPHIAERCLNHKLGKLIDTYDRGSYFDERRAALEKWDAEILRLIS